MLEDKEFIELGVMNGAVRGFRKIIRANKITGTGEEKLLVGVVLNKGEREPNRYTCYTLENDPINIASFICLNKEDKLVMNSSGGIVLNTLGNYIDLCADAGFLEELLPVLIRIQKNPRKRAEVRIVPNEYREGNDYGKGND